MERQSADVAASVEMKTKDLPRNGASRTLNPTADRALPQISRTPAKVRIGKVLVPTDFSAASDNASRYAVSLAHAYGSELIFVHVVPAPPAAFEAYPIDYPPELKETCEKALDALAQSARLGGIGAAQWVIRTGAATHEIVEAAKDLSTDLIVIATHCFTGWKHFAIGSTAERVARSAPCPVLVVREKEHEFLEEENEN